MNYFKLYNSLCKIVIIATCLVICAGGFVRMTGSGMGCPDWPKCFGLWIPPLNEADLPDNYIEIYGEKFSLLKNSDQIIDPSELDFLKFNVFKTWTEYINRLLGATAGLLCLILSIISFFTYHRKLIFLSLFLLFLFAFQGWMGSVVVGSILEPSQITIHMIIAVCIMALLFFLYRMTLLSQVKIEINNKYLIFIALIISVIQIILGTQVRQGVDEVFNAINSMDFIDHSIIYFEIHRTMAWLVVFSNLFILYFYRKKVDVHIERVTIMLMMSILIISGLFMTYQNLLGLGQLLHLICAVGLFLAQFSVLLKHYHFSIVETRPHPSIVETPSLE